MATDIDHDNLNAAFWELTDDHIAVLRPHGQVQQTVESQTLCSARRRVP